MTFSEIAVRNERDWLAYGRQALVKLGTRDVSAFCDWLAKDNYKMLAVYERDVEESIRLWDLQDVLRLPEGL